MKRVWLAVSILVLIPALVFATHFYLKSATGEMIGILKQADTLAVQHKTDESEKKIKKFIEEWEKNDTIMATFIRHSELDPANLSSAKLLPLLRNDAVADFSAECNSLEEQLNHIWESEKFSLDNIL